MNPIMHAARMAAKAHEGQTRQVTGEPYVTHPLRVAAAVMLRPDSMEEMVCAAMLHDTLEDTDLTPEEIRREMAEARRLGILACCANHVFSEVEDFYIEKFAERVAGLVVELTNQFTKEKRPDLNRKERKAREHDRLAGISREAKIIKLCDRIDNLSDAPFTDDDGKDFREVYLAESAHLLEALGPSDPALAQKLRGLIIKHGGRA